MPKEVQALDNAGKKQKRPSERTALFILGIMGWFRDIFTFTSRIVPRGQVIQHQGIALPAGSCIRYPLILLVEDNPNIAKKFMAAIENHYAFGAVDIHVAYSYDAAVTFFDNEDISLVIMDADLDDAEGDGTGLTRRFLGEKPETAILANSSSRISNMKLTGFGACSCIEKSTDKLQGWLLQNDPAGRRGA